MCAPRRVRSSPLLNFAFVLLLFSWDFSQFQPGPRTTREWFGETRSIVEAGTQESRIVSGWTAANRLISCGMWIFRSAEMGENLPSILQSESVAWDRIVAAKFFLFSCLGKWKSGRRFSLFPLFWSWLCQQVLVRVRNCLIRCPKSNHVATAGERYRARNRLPTLRMARQGLNAD